MTDPTLEPILAYLQEHSGRYSLEALRQQLIENGYDADSVDRAIQIHMGKNPRGRGMPTCLLAALIVAGLIVLLMGICFVVLLNN